MNKNTQNSEKIYNVEIIKALAEKYDFTPRYIRQILKAERTPSFAEKIITEYDLTQKKLTKILNNQTI